MLLDVMKIDNWKTQLRKGAAELAVLSLLKKEPMSGIGLLECLEPYAEIGLSEGTLYPLLKRLARDGRIIGEWKLSQNGGRPTKIYMISSDGKAALAAMLTVWSGFKKNLSEITGDKS